MILFLTKRGFGATLEAYLSDYAGDSASDIRLMAYEDLALARSIPYAAVVFSDLDRLGPGEIAFASAVHDLIHEQHPELTILNDPARSLRRYDLLNVLRRKGLNPVAAVRLTESVSPPGYPAFIRYEDDHTGSATDLLHDQAEVEAAIVRLRLRGHDLSRMILVEFVDTSLPDGMFVKYSVFRVGDRFIARSRNVSPHWVTKATPTPTAANEARARAYIAQNPHRDHMAQVFEAAHIEYGRADYSVRGDEIVTWEINTNPTAFYPRAQAGMTEDRQVEFAEGLREAFDAIQPIGGSDVIELDGIPDAIRGGAGHATKVYRPTTAKAWARRHRSKLEPAMGIVERLVTPANSLIVRDWERRNGIS
ncbi:MAG: hypothetical protein QNJ71_07840 [Acidimicrobiia bacterium]|nr:hypothetical protein [Acidimicrobiia bacterium]